MYGSIWIIPPLFGWGRFVQEGFGTSCTFDYKSKHRSNRLFILFLMIGGFMIPLSIIVLSYTLIIHRLHRRIHRCPNKAIYRVVVSFRSIETDSMNQNLKQQWKTSSIIRFNEQRNMWRRKSSHEFKATRRVIVICALFCFSWGPYSIAALLSQCGFDDWINPYSTSILGLFPKVAACLNPFLYALSSKSFRTKISCFLNYFRTPAR